MKLLADLSHWLPKIILIEIGVIVVVGAILLSLVSWKWVRRWWKKRPTVDELNLYQDLPSAEAFLDDWTMTKPAKMESSPILCHSQREARRESLQEFVEEEAEPQPVFEGEEIDGVLKTIIQVKRDLRQKNNEINDLSKKLSKQQTANKFAVKEKLMAMRRAELNKRALEQEVRNLELEREKAYEEMKTQEARSFIEAKEKMELVGQLVVKEKIMAERKVGLEMTALESEMRNLEEERDKAYEEAKEKERENFADAKNRAQKLGKVNLKIRHKINFSKITSLISNFKFVFNLDALKRSPSEAVIASEAKQSHSQRLLRRTFGSPRNDEKVITRKPVMVSETKQPPLDISVAPLGRKIISVTVPPELMS